MRERPGVGKGASLNIIIIIIIIISLSLARSLALSLSLSSLLFVLIIAGFPFHQRFSYKAATHTVLFTPGLGERAGRKNPTHNLSHTHTRTAPPHISLLRHAMAAAETATTVGTRRAVIRSERFMQWQRQLSSARRAPYGSRKRPDGNHTKEKESENVEAFKDLRGIEDAVGEDDIYQSDVSKVIARMPELQEPQQQSPGYKKEEREASPEHRKNGLFIIREGGVCDGRQTGQTVEQSQQQQNIGLQQQQHEPVSTLPIKRRGRRTPSKDQEFHPSARRAADGANAKIDHANGNKRSTRLLARTLRTEEPPPPPLKFPKIHVVLSRKEVQEDWLKITGQRYAGKPRKSALTHLGLGLCTSLTCPSTIRRYLNDP